MKKIIRISNIFFFPMTKRCSIVTFTSWSLFLITHFGHWGTSRSKIATTTLTWDDRKSITNFSMLTLDILITQPLRLLFMSLKRNLPLVTHAVSHHLLTSPNNWHITFHCHAKTVRTPTTNAPAILSPILRYVGRLATFAGVISGIWHTTWDKLQQNRETHITVLANLRSIVLSSVGSVLLMFAYVNQSDELGTD